MLKNTNSWIVRDGVVSSRGAKSCQIEHIKPEAGADSKIRFTLGSKEEPTRSPFGATTHDGQETAQKTIEFNLTDEEVDTFQGVVEWLTGYLAEHSERIFRKKMSREQVSDSLRNPVTQRGGYQPHLRCKLRPSSLRVWDASGKIREGGLPSDLRGYMLVPRITIEKLWMMSRECGLVLQVSDLMILDREEASCPFT